jgi:multidrug resistance protein, MATE family
MGAKGTGIATSLTHLFTMIGFHVYTEKVLTKE